MILGFKKKFPWGKPTLFKGKILSGTKIHSIREDKKRRWKAGMLIHMAYGVRTKFYECFCDRHRCKSIQKIKIEHDDWVTKVFIDDGIFFKTDYPARIMFREMDELSRNDGFENKEEFFKWFDKDFSGVIIHWTDFRY